MHKLLSRQIQRHFGSAESVPDALKPLIEAVDNAYQQADDDRRMLERSLDLTSKELLERFEKLAIEAEERKKASEALRQAHDELEKRVAERTEELSHANEQLILSRDKALAAVRAKSDFLATMSHEIRTPMNAVIGMTGILLATPLSEDQREYMAIVRSAGENLLSLINDILDFSKIEAGGLKLEAVRFDLASTIEKSIEFLVRSARDKGLAVTCSISSELPRAVRGDPGRLRQILTNLVANAVKFTEKGEIYIRVLPAAPASGRAGIRFEVRDTGIGISADNQSNLFTPFSQADASTTRKYGGTGLGLAICKRLCEMMGGAIGVESTLGNGAKFWFEVNLEAVQP